MILHWVGSGVRRSRNTPADFFVDGSADADFVELLFSRGRSLLGPLGRRRLRAGRLIHPGNKIVEVILHHVPAAGDDHAPQLPAPNPIQAPPPHGGNVDFAQIADFVERVTWLM